MAHKKVITKSRPSVVHLARSGAGASLCGIPAASTQKAAGPALKMAICQACQRQASASSSGSAR